MIISERGKRILKYFLTHSGTLSGQKISSECDISINTLRKEIGLLNDVLKEHGCTIEPRASQGYELVILDQKEANAYLTMMLQEIKRFSYLNLEENARAYTILRYLFFHDGFTYENIADALYCSKSTILREIKRMQIILGNYHLELRNQRNNGLFIIGNEWNKRMCLLFLEKAFRSLSEEERDQEPEFSSFIYRNLPLALQTRKTVHDRLNLSAVIHIPPVYRPKIINYVLIAKSRSSQRKSMHFTEEQISLAKDAIVYPFAKALCQSFPPTISQDFDETEYIAMSMLLQSYRSIASENEMDPDEYKANKEEATDIVDFISKRYDISDRIDEKCRQNLAYYLYSLKRMLAYAIEPDAELMEPYHQTGLLSTDLCVEFGKYYGIRHHIRLSEEMLTPAYYIFLRSLIDHPLDSFRTRILVSSNYGLQYGECIAARLRNEYGNNIDRIDVTTVTHDYAINEHMYDAVITDVNLENFRNLSLPVIPVSFIRDPENAAAIARFIDSSLLRRGMIYFPAKNMRRITCRSRSDIYEQIADCLKDDIVNKDDFRKDLVNREYYASSDRNHGIILLSCFSYTFAKPSVFLLVNDEPLLWNHTMGKYFIFYQYGLGRSREIYSILYLLKKLIHMDGDKFQNAAEEGYDALVQAMHDPSIH